MLIIIIIIIINIIIIIITSQNRIERQHFRAANANSCRVCDTICGGEVVRREFSDQNIWF